ncbi:MAG: GGDEF domain-containing protein [Acidobacteriia bacterium]|nr:GGDEF domain-containing protein [Terriglobia bacterium]
MQDQAKLVEAIGPQARLQAELSSLEAHHRDVWILIVFAAAVLLLGALSMIIPGSFWEENTLEMKIPPQVLFTVMMVVMVLALYMVRREVEVRKLRLLNVQHTLSAQSELAASMVDSLTNVFSRTFLRELLQGEISRAERNKRPLGLVMCDVDNFKSVNDRFGHLMGDYVLAQIAGILKSCVRGSDYVVRYGGDEFLIVLSETDAAGSQIVTNRIRQKVSEWDRANRLGDFSVGISLGLHQHVAGQSVEQAVSQADARMYAEKQATREKSALAANRPT